jgi:hypothetical protein
MAYTSTTFGATNQYSVYHPDTTRLFVFSPYFLEVTTDTAGQTVTITSNGISLSRVSNASKKAKFPISRLIQTFFAGIDFGEVLPPDSVTYLNSASKLVLADKDIVIQVDTDVNTKTLTYDMLWGAIQAGESETTERDIYVWWAGEYYLPISVTDNVGVNLGKEIGIDYILNDTYETPPPYFDIVDSGLTLMRRYFINYMPYCAGGIYLRWISVDGEYRYYYFKPATNGVQTGDAKMVKQNVWTNDLTQSGPWVSANNSDEIISSKKMKPYIECGISSADYRLQVFMQSLETSLKQWLYVNSGWVEVIAEVDPIIIDRFRSNQEINVKITKPSLYLQSI